MNAARVIENPGMANGLRKRVCSSVSSKFPLGFAAQRSIWSMLGDTKRRLMKDNKNDTIGIRSEQLPVEIASFQVPLYKLNNVDAKSLNMCSSTS